MEAGEQENTTLDWVRDLLLNHASNEVGARAAIEEHVLLVQLFVKLAYLICYATGLPHLPHLKTFLLDDFLSYGQAIRFADFATLFQDGLQNLGAHFVFLQCSI